MKGNCSFCWVFEAGGVPSGKGQVRERHGGALEPAERSAAEEEKDAPLYQSHEYEQQALGQWEGW